MRTPANLIAGWLLIFTSLIFSASCAAEELKIGQAAPEFNLPDQYGKTHTLATYQGKWVVLYFYPKDDSPGCTEQACRFRDDIAQLNKLGTQVLGISLDSQSSHAAFTKKHGLPFPLLADEEGTTAAAYQALTKIGPIKLAKRHTFIIDPQGKLAQIYRKVDTSKHSTEIIEAIKTLQTSKPK